MHYMTSVYSTLHTWELIKVKIIVTCDSRRNDPILTGIAGRNYRESIKIKIIRGISQLMHVKDSVCISIRP